MNVGEYNTIDMVEENTKKKTTVFEFLFVSEVQEKGHTLARKLDVM